MYIYNRPCTLRETSGGSTPIDGKCMQACTYVLANYFRRELNSYETMLSKCLILSEPTHF